MEDQDIESRNEGTEPLENEQHERFCLEVLNGKSATNAYRLIYPEASYNSARSAGARLLKTAQISKRLEHLREEQRTRLRTLSEDVLMVLVMIAQFDPADLFHPDGSLIPLHELPPEVRLCIERIEYTPITIGGAEQKKTIGRTIKIHVISKTKVLELLGRYHRLFTDKDKGKGGSRISLEDLLNRIQNFKEGESNASSSTI